MDHVITASAVVELRQYTLRPGQRDVLVELFDRAFVESQEELGMQLLGQFRDLDRPDRFVWLRGFPALSLRAEALRAFYGGPVWAEHGPAANATMLDWSDVLLLRPAGARAAFDPAGWVRPPGGPVPGVGVLPPAVVTVTIHDLAPGVDADDAAALFEQRVAPVLRGTGAEPVAVYVTEAAENDFPALPVRTGESVLVSVARFDRAEDLRQHERELRRSRVWQRDVGPALGVLSRARPQRLRLAPTPRSSLR